MVRLQFGYVVARATSLTPPAKAGVFLLEAISGLGGDCFGWESAILAMTCDIDKINRPSRLRRAI